MAVCREDTRGPRGVPAGKIRVTSEASRQQHATRRHGGLLERPVGAPARAPGYPPCPPTPPQRRQRRSFKKRAPMHSFGCDVTPRWLHTARRRGAARRWWRVAVPGAHHRRRAAHRQLQGEGHYALGAWTRFVRWRYKEMYRAPCRAAPCNLRVVAA